MPSPFSQKKPADKSTGTVVETVPVLNSCLTCQYCFTDSTEGTYYPQKEWLVWDCDSCGRTNIVKDIQL